METKNQNANSIQSRIDKLDVEKYQKNTFVKERMYKFEYQKLDFEQQKQKRNSLRRKLRYYVNNLILLFVHKTKNNIKNEPEIKKLVSEFQNFYKETYVKNDLNVSSVYRGNDQLKINDFVLFFDIIKQQISKS